MIALGFLVALRCSMREAERRGLDPKIFSDLAAPALLLGVAGTRVLHIMMYHQEYSWSDPIGWIAIWRGGLVFQGMVIPTLLYAWYHLNKNSVSFWAGTDIVVPYIPLAHAFGRLGCFCYGCCYGVRTNLPWGIPFPRVPWDFAKEPVGSPAYLDHCMQYSELSYAHNHWSYPVHPTQLYSAAGLVVICLILLFLRKRWNPFTGFCLPTYLVIYSLGRFALEFLRGDHNPTRFGVLSDQQIIGLLTAVAGVLIFLAVGHWQRHRRPPQETPKKA